MEQAKRHLNYATLVLKFAVECSPSPTSQRYISSLFSIYREAYTAMAIHPHKCHDNEHHDSLNPAVAMASSVSTNLKGRGAFLVGQLIVHVMTLCRTNENLNSSPFVLPIIQCLLAQLSKL